MSVSIDLGGLGSFGLHSGSAPEPFDALDGPRLAGPQGSHPLHAVRAGDLVRPTDGAVTGEIAYVIRVLVDRRFRNDAAIEQPLAIV
jgi:hypothetical protein